MYFFPGTDRWYTGNRRSPPLYRDVELMKGREVYELLHKKIDPRLLKVLVAIADNQSILSQKIMDMAQLIDQMSNVITMNVTVMENMKSTIDKIRKEDVPDPETEH